jgi:hypothetical protein
MATLKTWRDTLDYVNRLGFAGSGSIQCRQDALMCVVQAIERAAGVPRCVKGDVGYPIRITFKCYVDHGTGYRYPWLGRFEIRRADGANTDLQMANVSMDLYLANRGK